MNHRSLVHRLVGVVGAGALVLASVALDAAPAMAAPFAGQAQKQTTFSATGAGCAVTSPGSTSPATNFAAGAPVSLAQALSTSGTGPTAPDTATLSAAVNGSFVAHEAGGVLTDFSADATASTSVNRALGGSSACTWNSTAAGTVVGTFTSNGGLWDVHLSLFGAGNGVAEIILIKGTGGATTESVVAHVGQNGRSHSLISAAPGDYTLEVVVEAMSSGSNTANSAPPASNAHVIVSGVFRGFGVADGAASGTGTKYLDLAGSLTCASHSVKGDFTNKAGKKVKHGQKPVIKKAVFFVNGAKVKSVNKPNKKTTVTLAGLPDTDTVDVSAQLTLTGGGKVTVERSYLPCS
jgi:hypothetical protein